MKKSIEEVLCINAIMLSPFITFIMIYFRNPFIALIIGISGLLLMVLLAKRLIKLFKGDKS